jgi:hypothetical protein
VPRRYSPDFVEFLDARNVEDGIGIVLAKKCVKANLPMTVVSKILGVSRQTIHAWFRGGAIQSDRLEMIDAFMAIIDRDLAEGVLPLQDFKEAKKYYLDFIGPA